MISVPMQIAEREVHRCEFAEGRVGPVVETRREIRIDVCGLVVVVRECDWMRDEWRVLVGGPPA